MVPPAYTICNDDVAAGIHGFVILIGRVRETTPSSRGRLGRAPNLAGALFIFPSSPAASVFSSSRSPAFGRTRVAVMRAPDRQRDSVNPRCFSAKFRAR